MGYWWAGVSITALASVRSNAATSIPSRSTGTGTISAPAARNSGNWYGEVGSSIARRIPPNARVSSVIPSATPPTTTIRSGRARAARTLPRYSASATRNRSTPAASG